MPKGIKLSEADIKLRNLLDQVKEIYETAPRTSQEQLEEAEAVKAKALKLLKALRLDLGMLCEQIDDTMNAIYPPIDPLKEEQAADTAATNQEISKESAKTADEPDETPEEETAIFDVRMNK